MAKIKVMHIINNLEIGGAETILALVNRELKGYDDIDSMVVSLEGHGPLEAEMVRNGVRVKNFHYRLFLRHIHKFDPYFRIRLFLFALQERPDIIHGHLLGGEDFAKVLGMLLRRPVVTTLHDTMIWPGVKQRFLNRFITKAIAVSPPVAKHLAEVYGLPDERIEIIPNAVDMDKFRDSKKVYDPAHPVFIYVGRLFSTKGIEFAMEGLSRLWAEHPEIEFLIYGKQVFEQDYIRWTTMAKERGWTFVTFMGPTNDVPAALATGDVFVLPSQTEGFSIAVLEAAAASKPIIATRAGSIPEMVVEGESGYFVEYGDAGQIYEAAKKLIEGNDVETFGHVSYETVEHKFNIRKVARMHHDLYASIKA